MPIILRLLMISSTRVIISTSCFRWRKDALHQSASRSLKSPFLQCRSHVWKASRMAKQSLKVRSTQCSLFLYACTRLSKGDVKQYYCR